MLLEVENVSKTFPGNGQRPEVTALAGLTFSVGEREFVAVLGPSGCGKSTALRLAAGLDSPSSGVVHFLGDTVTGPGRDRGLVFQSYGSFPWLSVARNVEFGLRHMRLPRRERQRRADQVLSLVGLSDFRDALPHELSGGMQQRVALARCLAVEPRLLLLDEPFSAVDAITRRHLQTSLREIVDSVGTTTLFVTHDVEEAILLADRVLVMTERPGSIRCECNSALLSQPSLARSRTSQEFQELRRELTMYLEPGTSQEAPRQGN